MAPVSWFLYLAAILFTIGLAGVLMKRNALIVMMSVELMLNAANLTFLAFARQRGDLGGHAIAFFVIAVAASEAAIGLAIVIAVFAGILDLGIDIGAQIADGSQFVGTDPTIENLIGAGPHVEVPADLMSATFRLRPESRFHNGDPVRADFHKAAANRKLVLLPLLLIAQRALGERRQQGRMARQDAQHAVDPGRADIVHLFADEETFGSDDIELHFRHGNNSPAYSLPSRNASRTSSIVPFM